MRGPIGRRVAQRSSPSKAEYLVPVGAGTWDINVCITYILYIPGPGYLNAGGRARLPGGVRARPQLKRLELMKRLKRLDLSFPYVFIFPVRLYPSRTSLSSRLSLSFPFVFILPVCLYPSHEPGLLFSLTILNYKKLYISLFPFFPLFLKTI